MKYTQVKIKSPYKKWFYKQRKKLNPLVNQQIEEAKLLKHFKRLDNGRE